MTASQKFQGLPVIGSMDVVLETEESANGRIHSSRGSG